MKKLSALIISALLFTGMLGLNTGAAAAEQKNQTLVSQTTEYFEDGSSVIISVYEDDMPATRAGTFTKSGSKTYTMKNNSGKKLWSFTLNGSFSVNSGVSSSCTSSSYSSKIEDDAWSLKTASAVKSGFSARRRRSMTDSVGLGSTRLQMPISTSTSNTAPKEMAYKILCSRSIAIPP